MRVYSTISWEYGTRILNVLKEKVKNNDLKFSGFEVLWERNEGDEDGNCLIHEIESLSIQLQNEINKLKELL